MATEEDRTDTGVAGTAIAIGVAAMIAGSAALVGMARTEMQEAKEEAGGFADLGSIRDLNAEQRQKLTTAKLSIDKAGVATLQEIRRDAKQASPWTSAEDTVVAPSGSATPAQTGDLDTAASAPIAASAAPADTTSAPAPTTSAPTTSVPPAATAPVPPTTVNPQE